MGLLLTPRDMVRAGEEGHHGRWWDGTGARGACNCHPTADAPVMRRRQRRREDQAVRREVDAVLAGRD